MVEQERLSYREYRGEVREAAQEAVVQAAACEGVEDYDVEAMEFVFAEVDSHRMTIYYYCHQFVMEHTENPDAGWDQFDLMPEEVAKGGWLMVRGWFAFWAFYHDVCDEVLRLGRVVGGLEDEFGQAERLLG